MQTPLSKLNVLVYNWHEPYICLFARTGHSFFVAPPKQHPQESWNQSFRPLPENVTEVTSEQAEAGLRDGRFDLLICLTLQDVLSAQDLRLPRLFVMLNMIGTDVGLEGARKEESVEGLRPLFKGVDIAFISEKKRADWGWDAPVVVSGIDPDDYGDFNGELPRVLRVGNMLKERDHMQGFGIQEEILGDRFPSSIVGVNPSIPASTPSKSWDDLKHQFRQHRLLLNTLTDRHEDGYNLALLEAMATGMPVVSIANSSSPIIDGFNGFVSDDLEYLRQKIQLLLNDPAAAAELGRNGRRTVEDRFHIERCASHWNELFQQCLAGSTSASAKPVGLSQRVAAKAHGTRLKILLAAPSNPLTTSAYYERALRRSHDLLTCGPKVDERTMGQWKQWEDQHAFKAAGTGDADKMGLLLRLARDCDVPLPWGKVSAAEVMAALPSDWKPDLVIWIDSGPEFLITNPEDFGCATACLIGDLHTGQSNWRIEYARQFQHAFVMFNRDHVAQLTATGCNAGWLPAACEPEIHRAFDVPKAYDVVFVGQTMPAWHKDRVRLLERLKEAGFDLRVDSKILEEMALLFSRGRLVFNRSLNGDLNMRVFEAMACGSLLITDRLPNEAGLGELFEDRRHLVLYDEEDLEELVVYYLKNEDEREEIAECGLKEVLAHHTYGHRADQLLAQIFGAHEVTSCVADSPEPAKRAAVPGPAKKPELPAYYQNQRPEIIALIPPHATRILDVGCAAGEMGRLLKSQRSGVQVVGIEKETRAAHRARSNLDAVIGADMDELETLPYPVEFFDCITCGDILEHLRDPEAVVNKLLPDLKPGGSLVCSIPNIRHQSVLLDLLVNGRWQYRDEGLLDRTHIHFFTLAEIQAMMKRLGLQVARMSASQSPVEAAMEPILKAVGALGGDAEGARHESRIMQYIFQATRDAVPVQATIVMPVYNQAEHTERCLHALAGNDEAEPSYELVVVDNASTDWTPYLLNSFEGDVQVLSNDTNLGFARACNQGAKAARGAYVVFLNNDTLPHPGWLKAMVDVAESDPEVGIVGAKLLYPDSEKVQHAGLVLHDGVPEHQHRGADYRDPRVDVQCEMDMVTGACMLVRKQLFEELGGFDEAYLNGVEDVDFCLRVREHGIKVVYCPHAVLDHWEGSSAGRFDSVNANLQRFTAKWGNRFDSQGRFAGRAAGTTASILRGNFEGSFFLPSSLAHVNRELLREILETGSLEIGAVPFEEDSSAVTTSRFQAVAECFGHVLSDADFHLRHHWPPNFTRPPSGKLVLMQHWEFGRIPSAWIAPIRENVDQIWTATNYVRNCYLDSGIAPENVAVVPLGVDVELFNPESKPMSLETRKSFKFLFVGGTLYRKGIDLLLQAYRSAFSRDDDVCLVIKDMGTTTFYRNQHAGDTIRAMQQDPSCPEILYITEDLKDDAVASLYAACDCLVHPYRGEGFGLPVVEAMACALPTIVTAGGACDDFCDSDTSFLVPATRRDIQFEQPTAGQAWLLEPDSGVLVAQMREVFEHPDQARDLGQLAARKIASSFTWQHAARAAVDTLQTLCRPDAGEVGTASELGQSSSPIPVQAAVPAALAINGREEVTCNSTDGGRVAVIVLGGATTEDVSGFAPPGTEIERYDVQVAPGLRFGEQFNAIYRHSTCDIIAVVAADACPTGSTSSRLIEHLQAQTTCAMIGLGNGSASNGHALEQVEYLEPSLVLMRRAAIESVSGADSGFHTAAAIDDLARCCRRQGWSVVKDNGSLNPLEGGPEQGSDLLLRERAAVHEIERGDRLKAAGDLAGALAAYDSALEKKEDYVEAIIVRASVLVERGEPEVAVGSLERLVQIDPGSARAWNYLGLVQYQSEQWDKSSASFEKALHLDADSVEVLVNLAVLQWEQGASNEALDNLERAAAIEPSNRDVIVNTALIHAQVGNAPAAIELLQRFTAENPSDLDAKVVQGELFLEQGETAKARALALEVLASQAGHERALCLLENLGGQKEPKSEA